jgi:hypothetical protein
MKRRRVRPPALAVDGPRVGAADAKCLWCGRRRRCAVFLPPGGVELALCRDCALGAAQLVAHSMAASARRPHLKPCSCFDCGEWDRARSAPTPPTPPDARELSRFGWLEVDDGDGSGTTETLAGGRGRSR